MHFDLPVFFLDAFVHKSSVIISCFRHTPINVIQSTESSNFQNNVIFRSWHEAGIWSCGEGGGQNGK